MLRRLMIASAGDSPIPSSARYWRILMESSTDASWYSAQEIEFRGSIGGSDLTSPSLAATSAFGLSWYVEGPPRCAFDGDLANFATGAWVAAKTPGQYVGWDFGTPVTVAEVAILPQARADLTARAPTQFMVQKSDDNLTWVDVASFAYVSGWSVGVWKTFNW